MRFSQLLLKRTADKVPVIPNLPLHLPYIPGNIFCVDPRRGSDSGANGQPDRPFKSFQRAWQLCQPNQNDTILFVGGGNASAYCTEYLSATFDWSKDLVHLIGVNSGVPLSQRSRIAFLSTYDTASNLFTVSANGCFISGVQFYEGVAGTNPTGCVKVTGSRNRFDFCHFAGIGNNANDIAGAYSLMLDGAAENFFKNCVVGLDTIARGTAANSGLLVDSAATRNIFEDCDFNAFLEHATNHVHVRTADATAIDRFLRFKRCHFNYESANYAVGGTGVMNVSTLTQGRIEVIHCTANSDKPTVAVKWDVNDGDKVYIFNIGLTAADTNGLGRAV